MLFNVSGGVELPASSPADLLPDAMESFGRLWPAANSVDMTFTAGPVIIAISVLGLLVLDLVLRRKYVKDHFSKI